MKIGERIGERTVPYSKQGTKEHLKDVLGNSRVFLGNSLLEVQRSLVEDENKELLKNALRNSFHPVPL